MHLPFQGPTCSQVLPRTLSREPEVRFRFMYNKSRCELGTVALQQHKRVLDSIPVILGYLDSLDSPMQLEHTYKGIGADMCRLIREHSTEKQERKRILTCPNCNYLVTMDINCLSFGTERNCARVLSCSQAGICRAGVATSALPSWELLHMR